MTHISVYRYVEMRDIQMVEGLRGDHIAKGSICVSCVRARSWLWLWRCICVCVCVCVCVHGVLSGYGLAVQSRRQDYMCVCVFVFSCVRLCLCVSVSVSLSESVSMCVVY